MQKLVNQEGIFRSSATQGEGAGIKDQWVVVVCWASSNGWVSVDLTKEVMVFLASE